MGISTAPFSVACEVIQADLLFCIRGSKILLGKYIHVLCKMLYWIAWHQETGVGNQNIETMYG